MKFEVKKTERDQVSLLSQEEFEDMIRGLGPGSCYIGSIEDTKDTKATKARARASHAAALAKIEEQVYRIAELEAEIKCRDAGMSVRQAKGAKLDWIEDLKENKS